MDETSDGAANAERRARVVIVGGGFGGLSAARALRHAKVAVTLIDRRNHHLFQPLLYQVATAALNGSEIAQPLRRIVRSQKNTTVLLAEVQGIDLEARQLDLGDSTLSYDALILAPGASHSYFGHDEFARFAPGLKNIEDAVEIRRRILFAFERAERASDPADVAAWLTFVLVGGGPTGVELAGALAEIARNLRGEFRHIDPSDARVILVEGAPRILLAYPPPLAERAAQQLAALGVEVRSGALVTGVDDDGIWLGKERIRARTVVWAAGVEASPLTRRLGVALDRAGRVEVAPDLSLPGHPEVFAVGDIVALRQGDKAIPGVAPAAMQAGRQAARNVLLHLAGRPTEPFHYRDKGSLATIGRNAAIADFGRVQLSGFLAWLAWLFVHILFLIGFRNRFVVLFDWGWAYLTRQRAARIITYSDWRTAARDPVPTEGKRVADPDGDGSPDAHA